MNLSELESVNDVLHNLLIQIRIQVCAYDGDEPWMDAKESLANHLWCDYMRDKVCSSVTTTDKMVCLAEISGYLSALGNNGLIHHIHEPDDG